MPSGKTRDLEDTWKPEELEKSLKGTSSRKDKDKRDRDRDKEKRKDKDRDKDKEKRRKDDDPKKERRHRDKENGEPEKSRDKHRDKEKQQKSKDEGKDKDRRERRHKEEDRDKEKRKKRDEDGKERRHRDKDGERNRDDDKKRRHREKDDADDDKRRRHREDRDGEKKERRKHRDEENGEVEDRDKRRRHKDEDEDGHRDRDRRRRHRETSEERHERKKREKEEEKRRKEKEEEERRKKEQEEENGGDDYDYEDDFEDYEDDFEDDEGDDGNEESEDDNDYSDKIPNGKSRGEMDEVLRAMNEENERLVKQSRDGWSESESESSKSHSKRPTTASGRTFINFVSAKQRAISNKAASKAKQRGRDLLQIIDMDKAAFDMFDMPPVNEYEMYMRSFGQSNTKQAYVQTNDDNIDREIQTEEIETTEKWSQHPPEDIKACGGGDNEAAELDKQMKPTDTMQLSKFLSKAGQVIAILLEESLAEESRGDKGRKQSNIYISEAFSELGQVPFLQGRHVVYSHFSSSQPHLLLTVHSMPNQVVEDDSLYNTGFVCLWNVNEPSAPQKILVCESPPLCCCFSPVKSTLAFAGMSEGSLAVWDLRETSAQHRKHTQSKREWLFRAPTYNTAGVLHYDNHQSAVRTIAPIAGPASTDLTSGSEESGLSFQLASIEENSTLHLWVVAEITHPDLAGSESDLGLAPGGKIKLIKSSTIVLENPLRDTRLRTTMKSFELQLLPSDPSHFYVTTDTGCIIHGVRYGGKAPPRAYRTDDDSQIDITCIDFSPFPEPVFLAGSSDGTLRLYSTSNELPLLVWPRATEGRPITQVRWCRSRPSVFFVLDDQSNMYIWDLLMNDVESLKKEKISQHRVTSFALSNDHSATGIGMPGRTPQMMIGLSSGEIEVHTISQKFSALMTEEVDQFSQFISSSM